MKDPGQVLQGIYDAFTERLDDEWLPNRRFIHAGDLAYDCEQFVVRAGPMYQGAPASPSPVYTAIPMYAMDVAIEVVRGVPSLDSPGRKPPTPAQLTEMALRAANDAKALSDAYWQAHNDRALAPVCDNIVFSGVTYNGPLGNMLGTILGLSIQL